MLFRSLKREYKLLRTKFNLKNIDKCVWKLFRLRPTAFPQLRIAFLSTLFYCNKKLITNILEITSLEDLRNIFNLELNQFWDYHYQFEDTSSKLTKKLGSSTIDSIIINGIIPFIFAYGHKNGVEQLEERALSFLEQISFENNKFVRNWIQHGFKINNAFDSQAIIHLRKEYCEKKKCLYF